MKSRLRLMLLAIVTGCGTGCGSQLLSTSQDIYRNDSETRHDATPTELVWTVSLGGCTGSMLTGSLMLTANHCTPQAGDRYTSGAALLSNAGRDLTAVRVIESSSSFDYSIVEVRWSGGTPSRTQRYTPLIMTSESQLTLGVDSVSTELFTVGFPVDRNQRATHAVGRSKSFRTNSLMYNVGSINGNSGGAVWRKDNLMLVSQTNFGPHSYGQAGWNNNNLENENAWNGGGRMDRISAQSQILQQVFPNGVNRYVNADGTLNSVTTTNENWDELEPVLDSSRDLPSDIAPGEDFLLNL